MVTLFWSEQKHDQPFSYLKNSFKEAGDSFQHFSNSFTLTDEYYLCLSSDNTILVSRKSQASDEPIMVIFMA